MSSISGIGLPSLYGGQAALSLLSSNSSSSSNAANTASLLLSYYQAKEGIPSSSTDGSTTTPTGPNAPWNAANPPSVSQTVQNAVDGQAFISPTASSLSAPAGASSQDYENLFALYQGLNTLQDIAQTAATMNASTTPSTSGISLAQLESTFKSGLSQVQTFLSNDPFSEFNVTAGKVEQDQTSTVGIANGSSSSYTTGVIGTGDESSQLSSLEGDVQFTISVQNKYATTPTPVNINLDDMGSRPRTIDNVVNYINTQLKAAGVQTTFSVANLGNATTTTNVGGQTTTTTGQPQWGFTINEVGTEQLSFSAPQTAGAVFVGQATGGVTASTTGSTSTSTTNGASTTGTTTTPAGEELLKLQTTNSATGPNINNDTNLPASGIFSKTLPTGVNSVQASATGPDGSLYMVADVSGTFAGAPVPGQQGVALLKYNAAGKLLYSKTLGGETDATGYSIAVNTDGSVAVAGSNTVAASTALTGITTPASTSGFVQVFDPTGAPSWTQTIPASNGTATVNGVAFGSDGSVYVDGTTTGSVGNQLPTGSTSDEFIQGFDPTGKATFTSQFGALGANTANGLAYNSTTNSLYTVGTENGKAVVRQFGLNGTSAPTQLASRNLGTVTGVAGIGLTNGQVVVAGSVEGATINTANTAQAYIGVGDGFVATLQGGLATSPSDTVTYMGLAGATQSVTALSVSGGQAYVTGTIADDPNSTAVSGGTEGFVTGVNTATGAASYNATFIAAGGSAAPTTIAAATGGASVLDALGLPNGALSAPSSNLIVANTPIQAGQSFYIKTSPNGPQTAVTVSATDTLATLTTKINNALGPWGTVTVLNLSSGSELQINPANSSAYIELDSQPNATNALLAPQGSGSVNVLAALGLSPGVIRTVNTVNNGLTDPTQLREYGLNLPPTLDLSTAAGAQAAVTAMQAAIGTIQQAYQDLVSPPTLASEEQAQASNSSSSGSVPAYLTAEIANYQAGLERLTGQAPASSTSS